MITTSERNLAEKMRTLSLHGLSRDAWKRYSKNGSWYYEIEEAGFKYNMYDIQAAIGLKQLEKFDNLQDKRKRLARYYFSKLSDIDEIILPYSPAWTEHAWHLFVIRLKGNDPAIERNELIQNLHEHGIGTSVHFIPLHIHPYYKTRYRYSNHDFPNAYNVYQKSLSLPLYPKMTFGDVDYVSDIIHDIFANKYSRTVKTSKGDLVEKII